MLKKKTNTMRKRIVLYLISHAFVKVGFSIRPGTGFRPDLPSSSRTRKVYPPKFFQTRFIQKILRQAKWIRKTQFRIWFFFINFWIFLLTRMRRNGTKITILVENSNFYISLIKLWSLVFFMISTRKNK